MSDMRTRVKILAYLSAAGERSAAEILMGANVWTFRLYPALRGLEESGSVEIRWVDGPYPRRRLYRLVKDATNEKPRRVG